MKNTIVCECFNITVDDINEKIIAGTESFDELQTELGIGSGCPGCNESNRALFERLIDKYRLFLLEEKVG